LLFKGFKKFYEHIKQSVKDHFRYDENFDEPLDWGYWGKNSLWKELLEKSANRRCLTAEELTKKEIHKALRSRIAVEQAKLDFNGKEKPQSADAEENIRDYRKVQRPQAASEVPARRPYSRTEAAVQSKTELTLRQKQIFKRMLDDLIGTRGAYILDQNLEILGKVPTMELLVTIKSLKNAFAVVFDGVINKDMAMAMDKTSVKYLVAMESRVKEQDGKMLCISNAELVA